MDEWEKKDIIIGTKREIERIKGKINKLYQEGWKINYNSVKGQKQSEKLQQEIEDAYNQLSILYEDLADIKQSKREFNQNELDVTFTAEIQRDGRIQIPGNIRKAKGLDRGDVLEIKINKKL